MWKTPLQIQRIAIFFGLIGTGLGCSTSHDFRPTRSAEEVSSEREIIALCSSYQIQGEYTEVSSADGTHQTVKPVAVEALKPWLKCFETSLRRFDSLRSNAEFALFFHALQNAAGPDLNSPDLRFDWLALNRVVQTISRHFLDERYDYRSGVDNASIVLSADERESFEKCLPLFLLSQKRDSGSKNGESHFPQLKEKLSPAQLQHCSSRRHLQMLKKNLADLDLYRKELVGSKAESTQLIALEKLQERRLQLIEEINKLKPVVENRSGIQFSEAACFEKNGAR